VVTSAKPLRALAIASGAAAALAIVVPLLLGRLAAWLGKSELGSLVAAAFTVAHVLSRRHGT
jgi:hypothetical protein